MGTAAIASALIPAVDAAQRWAEGPRGIRARHIPYGVAAERVRSTHRCAARLVLARRGKVLCAAVSGRIAARWNVIRAARLGHLDAHIVPRRLAAEHILLAHLDAAVASAASGRRMRHEARAGRPHPTPLHAALKRIAHAEGVPHGEAAVGILRAHRCAARRILTVGGIVRHEARTVAAIAASRQAAAEAARQRYALSVPLLQAAGRIGAAHHCTATGIVAASILVSLEA